MPVLGMLAKLCVHFFKSVGEIAPDQFPHFLRAQVVGVVVPGTQNVSAENNSAFHFSPESFAARARIVIEEIFRIIGTVS